MRAEYQQPLGNREYAKDPPHDFVNSLMLSGHPDIGY